MTTEATAPQTEETPMASTDGMAEQDGTNQQYLTFTLDSETYGVDILKVQEIRGWTQETPIPNSPEFIRGVVNLRGSIVPVFDMRNRFNMSATEFTQYTVVIVVNVQGRTVGIVVDAVSDVVDYNEEDINPAPDFGSSIDSSFINGLATVDDKMVIILNIDRMLQSCELVELDKLQQNMA